MSGVASGWDWAHSVDQADRTPLHAQLERSIRLAIASGRLRPGDQLPTVRQLAVELRINANTVGRVYTQLEREKVLATRRGVGTFVTDTAAQADANDDARRQALASIVARALADASARGLSAADVRRELESLTKGAPS
jgi:GntR family transcriptional regulator